MPEEIKEQVKDALNGGAAPVPAPEVVPSPEVKPEAPKTEPVVVDKKEEQISNLNAALKEEREARKQESEARKKIEEEFNEAKPIIERFKNLITPETAPIDEKPKYMTQEEFETAWQAKQEEAKQQTFKEKQAEIINSEVVTLVKEWDGTEGRPKYVDEEVLKWQQENQKLYLSPKEAFTLMKANEIRDWEVKQVLSGKKKIENVEQPGVSPDIHTAPDNLPKTDKELREQIEAVINTPDEM